MENEYTYELDKETNQIFTGCNAEILFELARKMDCLKTIRFKREGEYTFALLDPVKDWSDGLINLNRLVDLLTKAKYAGFYKNDMIFLLKRNVPEEFEKFVVIHEIRERELAGVAENNIMDVSYYIEDEAEEREFLNKELEAGERYAHQEACLMELSIVFRQGKEFSEKYASWLIEMQGDPEAPDSFFHQAIPGFLKRKGRLLRPSLEIVIDFFLEVGRYSLSIPLPDDIPAIWPWMESYTERHTGSF